MARGRRPQRPDITALEAELATLKERHRHVRQQIRQLKGNRTGVLKLQEKLEKQLATAKWTVAQIHELQPDWDDVGFYQTVKPVKPTRGRRPKVDVPAAE
mgnify:CR=1 FL=1